MRRPGRRERVAVMTELTLKAKDFKTDQEVRWCPGCGDYAILAAVQGFMPELGVPRENIVFISGIGCSSRFPYYMNTYGMHSIHGRAPAIATGLSSSRPDLSVWVVTGDGDALSIGGNHLIHALRRNVNLKILLFNNRIYGLTKGQYSPTSEIGKVTKSTPMGSLDNPFNPVSVALGAEATFVARTLDSDRKHLTSVLRAAAGPPGHRAGGDLPELQHLQRRRVRPAQGRRHARRLDHPDGTRPAAALRCGRRQRQCCGARPAGSPSPTRSHRPIREWWCTTRTPRIRPTRSRCPDCRYWTVATRRWACSARCERPTYDAMMAQQLELAAAKAPGDEAALDALLRGADTWSVA